MKTMTKLELADRIKKLIPVGGSFPIPEASRKRALWVIDALRTSGVIEGRQVITSVNTDGSYQVIVKEPQR